MELQSRAFAGSSDCCSETGAATLRRGRRRRKEEKRPTRPRWTSLRAESHARPAGEEVEYARSRRHFHSRWSIVRSKLRNLPLVLVACTLSFSLTSTSGVAATSAFASVSASAAGAVAAATIATSAVAAAAAAAAATLVEASEEGAPAAVASGEGVLAADRDHHDVLDPHHYPKDWGSCERDLLISLHECLESTVAGLIEVQFNFTGARHFEVSEIISVYQVHTLAQSGLNFAESLRAVFSLLICPGRFDLIGSQDLAALPPQELVKLVGPSKRAEQFFKNVQYLADTSLETEVWQQYEQEILHMSQKMEGLVATLHQEPWQRLNSESYGSFKMVLERISDLIKAFSASLAEDVVQWFRAPNFVPREMIPPKADPTSLGDMSVGVNVFSVDAVGKTMLDPDFSRLLLESSTELRQPDFLPKFEACSTLSSAQGHRQLVSPEVGEDLVSVHRDITGLPVRPGLASPLQLLNAISRTTKLSNLFISVQVSPWLLHSSPVCGGKNALFDPTDCLVRRKWGGYTFQLNPMPPHNVTVIYKGKPLGPNVHMPAEDVHSIQVPTMDTQWGSLVATFKSMNHHSPDMLFLNPLVGNCRLAERMLGKGSIKPKLIYIPIDPTKAPPEESIPNFFQWWVHHAELLRQQLLYGVPPQGEFGSVPINTAVWLGQCSLTSAEKILAGYNYRLLHLEHLYAAFIFRPLYLELFEPELKGQDRLLESLTDIWLRGWHCSPMSRYLFDLEVLVEPKGSLPTPKKVPDAALNFPENPTVRYFLEKPIEGDPTKLGRGICRGGICECLYPYRGKLCQKEDAPRVEQKVKAAIHYITAETEHDLRDLERSLTTLWTFYNSRYDYPVIIFHEGLTDKSRLRLVEASGNRIWFAFLDNFVQMPPQWKKAADESAKGFALGYRAMIRWRSGPCFLEPALGRFDYAMTLDTDSYFPNDVAQDPFSMLAESDGWVAAFPHLGRESASVVVNFMHYYLLYCRLHGLNPRRTDMQQQLTEKNYKWYQQCLMLDIEILRLDFFRGPKYQDFFNFMDSTGGFWLHRWGNNPFRTFAVALLLEDQQVRSFNMPYAHQDFCSCGASAPPCEQEKGAKTYVCPEAAASKGTIGVENLAEGLLDLQPFRGTQRQIERMQRESLETFVAEQYPVEE